MRTPVPAGMPLPPLGRVAAPTQGQTAAAEQIQTGETAEVKEGPGKDGDHETPKSEIKE